MAAWGIVALHSEASRAHVFGHTGTPTGRIFEIWKGSSNSANPFWVHSGGDVLAAPITSPSLATTATDGFLYIRSCAGTPTGVPTNNLTGRVPFVYDRTGKKIWVYDAGWIGVVVA